MVFLGVIALTFASLVNGGSGFYVGSLKNIPDAQNSTFIHKLASFAVNEHNHLQNDNVVLSKVEKAQMQVTAGMVYYIMLEAINHNQPQLYTTTLWVVPWKNITKLQKFEPLQSSSTPNHGPVWHKLSAKDPVVQDATQNAMKIIQQRSNSLSPYELQGIDSAMEMEANGMKTLELLLRIKWNNAIRTYKVVMRQSNGKWTMASMKPYTGE